MIFIIDTDLSGLRKYADTCLVSLEERGNDDSWKV